MNMSIIRTRRILIVEDDLEMAKLIASYIKNDNFEIDTIYSGNNALETVKNGKYDLILLDIQMPGKTGYEVLSELKANSSTSLIPVIMLTNLGEMSSIEKAIELGAADYVIKLNTSKEKMIKLLNKYFIAFDARQHDVLGR